MRKLRDYAMTTVCLGVTVAGLVWWTYLVHTTPVTSRVDVLAKWGVFGILVVLPTLSSLVAYLLERD